MYTFCPNCQTIFRVTTRHLAAASGRTRCGECRLVYSAVDFLYDDLAATQAAQVQAGWSVDEQSESRADDQALNGREQMPVSADGWARRSLTLPGALSGVIVVFLTLVLAGQWIFFNRADLAREQNWRPGLEQFCDYLQCSLPLLVDLSQVELLNRDVRQHPRVEEALLVNATLSNTADFIQPYPVLEVSFSDLGGNTVALRRFRPEEYINDVYSIRRGMSPGKPVPIVLEIQDPGELAVSYQFGFL